VDWHGPRRRQPLPAPVHLTERTRRPSAWGVSRKGAGSGSPGAGGMGHRFPFTLRLNAVPPLSTIRVLRNGWLLSPSRSAISRKTFSSGFMAFAVPILKG
jgi:hypothetical protein